MPAKAWHLADLCREAKRKRLLARFARPSFGADAIITRPRQPRSWRWPSYLATMPERRKWPA